MHFSFITTLLLALSAQSAPLPNQEQSNLAPLYRSTNPSSRYIIALHPSTVDPSNRLTWLNTVLSASTSSPFVSAQSVEEQPGAVVHHWDEKVFNGLAGSFDDASLNVLRSQSQVAYIEEDITVHKTATSLSQTQTQTNSPWGIARLSSPTPLSVGQDFNGTNTTFPYTFPPSAGSNTDIYVLDTGVRTTHQEFGGRATFLATFNGGTPGEDIDGHGSHVAGTTAGIFFGMAKKANVFAVKVLDDQGNGAINGIISGLDLVAQRVGNQTNSVPAVGNNNGTNPFTPIFQTNGKREVVANANNFTLLNQLPNSLNDTSPVSNPNTTTLPDTTVLPDTTTLPDTISTTAIAITTPDTSIAIFTPSTTVIPPSTTTTTPPPPQNTTTANRAVVNMSLSGGHSDALDSAVQNLIAQGVVVVIAAGNSGTQIGNASPSDVAQAIVVGAMDVHDNVPSFSNFGSNVAVFAPGVQVISCGVTSDTAFRVLDGTSMSTPHITGLSALILTEEPTLTPAQVKAKIQSLALRGALGNGFQNGTGTQNLLAQNGFTSP